MDGRSATTHHNVLPFMERKHPEVHMVRGVRYVEDGNIISSAGITAGVDATLFTLQRMLGPAAAQEVVRKLGYPYGHFLSDPTYTLPVPMALGTPLIGYRIGNSELGVALYDGISEIALGSVIDTYPRNGAVTIHTIAPDRASVISRVVAGCASAPAPSAGELVINSWGGAWSQSMVTAFVQPFERETGIKVTMISSPDPAKIKAAVEAGAPPQEDLFDYNYATMEQLRTGGLLEPIDYSVFDPGDLAQLDPALRGSHGLGWTVFAWALAFDRRAFPDGGPQPHSWSDFFDTQRFPGGRMYFSMRADPLPEFALLADGVAVSQLYPIDIERALRKIESITSSIVKYPDAPAQIGQLLTDQEVVMGPALAHRIQKLIDTGVPLGISYAGARLETDIFLVPKGARNRANAMRFLAHVARARAQADWAEASLAAPVNPRAFDLITPEVASKFPTRPDRLAAEFWKNEAWYSARGADGRTNLELITERWHEWALR